MGVRRYKDLFAWQLADRFKEEIYRLILSKGDELRSWKYRDQILTSAGAVPKDISEGFIRYSPAQFAQFLTCGLASLAEAEDWLKDGVLLRYFTAGEASLALSLAKRAWTATLGLKKSQERELRRREAERRRLRSKKPVKPPPADEKREEDER